MKYDCANCPRLCLITDEVNTELKQVESVDTDTNTLVQYEVPFRVVKDEPVRITRTFTRADVTLDRFARAARIVLHGMQP